MKQELNIEGTTTGRFSSKQPAKSNTPQSDEPSMTDWPPAGVEICGMHLGPRTKRSNPYNYDPLLVFASRTPSNGSAYSDHLLSWYEHSVVRAKMQQYFGEQGDYYSNRKVADIQLFLRDLMSKPDLKITRIEEHCNQATGYPVWYFEFTASPETAAP